MYMMKNWPALRRQWWDSLPFPCPSLPLLPRRVLSSTIQSLWTSSCLCRSQSQSIGHSAPWSPCHSREQHPESPHRCCRSAWAPQIGKERLCHWCLRRFSGNPGWQHCLLIQHAQPTSADPQIPLEFWFSERGVQSSVLFDPWVPVWHLWNINFLSKCKFYKFLSSAQISYCYSNGVW